MRGAGPMTAAAAIIREQRAYERMVGDPRVAGGGLMSLRAAQYAAAMLCKRGVLPADAGGLTAQWDDGLRTVTFWRGGRFAAAYRIPDRVMDFDPAAPARAIEEEGAES